MSEGKWMLSVPLLMVAGCVVAFNGGFGPGMFLLGTAAGVSAVFMLGPRRPHR